MLIEFRVENHKSLRDEQVITLEAGRVGASSDSRPREVEGHRGKLLPAAVIYGANASGKSNLLAAFAFMREAVIVSHRHWEPESGIPRAPFAWGNAKSLPSMFEVTVLVERTKYAYGFSVDDNAVCEEWLFAWPNNRKQVWFERDGTHFKFGEHLKGPNETVREVTRDNALFLSAGAQHGHETLTRLYSWFRRSLPTSAADRRSLLYTRRFQDLLFFSDETQPTFFPLTDSDESLADRMRQLLRAADIGIVDMKRVETEFELRGQVRRRPRIMLQHQAGNEDSWLNLEEESDGTKTLFRLSPSVFMALESGGLLLVDELESSLHPLLGLEIVKLFNNSDSNPRNAQIVFTTHDTNLLGTTMGDPPLRRDQVWFAEKDDDGASAIYPLTDYKPRKVENLERGYLQGRYGAVPFLGQLPMVEE